MRSLFGTAVLWTVAGVFLFGIPAARAETLMIQRFLAAPDTGTVDVYSAAGKWLREAPIAALPAVPVAILHTSKNGALVEVQDLGWVKSSQVETSNPPTVRSPVDVIGCAVKGQSETRRVAAGRGLAAQSCR